MTLKDLINENSWLSVEYTLIELYPDEETSVNAYEMVYDMLSTMESAETDMEIVILEQTREGKDNKPFIEVSGRKKFNLRSKGGFPRNIKHKYGGKQYSLEFTPWNEWLRMEIDPSVFTQYSELEIISHCLWEMTFISFDENEIREQERELRRVAENIEDTLSIDYKLPNKDVEQ